MRDNIQGQIKEYIEMCERAIDEGCSDEVESAWERVSVTFGHVIPDYYDCLSGPESPRGDWRLLDLPLIIAKLRIFSAKLDADAVKDAEGKLKVSVEKTVIIDINAPFDRATELVVDDEALRDEDKSDFMIKIKELQNTAGTVKDKKAKWEKIIPVLTWLESRDANAADLFLPLISAAMK